MMKNPEATLPSYSHWQTLCQNFLQNKLAVAGLVFLVVVSSLCLLAPLISPYDVAEQDLLLGPIPPSLQHWLGTDPLGRDLFTRVLYGGRISLAVSFMATAVALIIGVSYGAIAGFCGGKIDAVMMRLVDIAYALPFMMLVILLMVVFGQSLLLLFLAIGAVEWLTMARIVRSQVMAIKQQAYVEAAQCAGLSQFDVIRLHILPNTVGPVIVYTTLTIPAVMLFEAFLSFLGLGVQAPDASWGALIADGVSTMDTYPWLILVPGSIFTLTLFALNFIGDGLRDAFDVRMTRA